jgi:serine/threonine protein kinase
MPRYFKKILIPNLSRYEIPLEDSSILGEGGMGVVLRAHDKLLNEEVAIKTINPNFVKRIDHELNGRLFFREASAHARLGLKYPEKIVPVRNYGIEDETPFMELELLHGGSLRDRINDAKQAKRKPPLFEEDEIKSICLKIGEAVAILHDEKVFHSDLKPENVLFQKKAKLDLKVADLGLAQIAGSGMLTQAGINTFFGGTKHYTPLEVLEGRMKANVKTDIYSLGKILYEMITGANLNWLDTNRQFIDKHKDISPIAKDIVIRACQLLGRNNFKTVEDFIQSLSKAHIF